MNACSTNGIDVVTTRLPAAGPRPFGVGWRGRRPGRDVRRPGSAAQPRPVANRAPPELSIEEAIARYVDANPAQLYRGGA